MAGRGRKPKSAAEKKLTGNPGKRAPKSGATASQNSAPALKMPSDLPPAAQKEWRRVVPKLIALGIVNGFDLTALADYCLCVARLAECERDVTARGILIQGERGMVKNPALQFTKEYRNQIHKWCEVFGLTPSSRGKMSLPDQPENDPFEEFLDDDGEEDEDDGGEGWDDQETD